MKLKLYYLKEDEIKSIIVKGENIKDIKRKINLILKHNEAMQIGCEYVG